MKDVIYKPLTLWDEPRDPHAAALIYRPSDPFAVELNMPRVNRDAVSVLFDRGLLIDGLAEPVGEGDVRIAPGDADGWISLTVPVDGERVEFYGARKVIDAFLDATLRRVPSGGELAPAAEDLDRWLAGALS